MDLMWIVNIRSWIKLTNYEKIEIAAEDRFKWMAMPRQSSVTEDS